MPLQIFLSHSSRDRQIADALQKLLGDFFGKRIAVAHSSDQTAGGGIPPGEQWLPWITEKITGADQTFVLLTPNSLNRPWVLWESGAAAGVAFATKESSSVVPISFGIAEEDIPSPFTRTQSVRGDLESPGGILRLLGSLSQRLPRPLAKKTFQNKVKKYLPGYLAGIQKTLLESAPLESLLASVPQDFSVKDLGGLWVTSYEFMSRGTKKHHADIARLTPESDRRARATNEWPEPRTEGHAKPFRNEIDFELADRHMIGHWKNLSDTRYFGAIHLAVLTGEDVMEGYYTSLASDISVAAGPWKWVRIDRETVPKDHPKLVLREPAAIQKLLAGYSEHSGPLNLAAVVEEK